MHLFRIRVFSICLGFSFHQCWPRWLLQTIDISSNKAIVKIEKCLHFSITITDLLPFPHRNSLNRMGPVIWIAAFRLLRTKHINKNGTKESHCNAIDDDDDMTTTTSTDGNQRMTAVNDERDRQYNMFIYQNVRRWKMKYVFGLRAESVCALFLHLGSFISVRFSTEPNAGEYSLFRSVGRSIVGFIVAALFPVFISVNFNSSAWCYFNHHISLYKFESRIQISERFFVLPH